MAVALSFPARLVRTRAASLAFAGEAIPGGPAVANAACPALVAAAVPGRLAGARIAAIDRVELAIAAGVPGPSPARIDPGEPAIAAHGLARWYDEPDGRRVHALAERAFTARRGESIALVGRSGCGKSTMLHLLGLLDPPDAGSLVMLGRDVSTLGANGRSRMRLECLGFVFQNFCLLKDRSVLENVELPLLYAGVARRERTRRALAWLERLGVQELWRRHPGELSGGQQQRVAIARALVGGPAIVLADEPTGSLDPDTGTRVMDALFDSCTASGATCIVATHDLALAQRFDRIEHMDPSSGPTRPERPGGDRRDPHDPRHPDERRPRHAWR